MSLSVINNIASLTASANLNNTSTSLNASLQKLSTGLKINTGADGPAAYVISQQQTAQISGLTTAIENTNNAVSFVQTGEGALNQISSLLTKMRLVALDSANSGGDDPSALGVNQAEIEDAANTIEKITDTTTFDGAALFSPSGAASEFQSPTAPPGLAAITTQMAAFGTQSNQAMTTLANTDFTSPSGSADAIAVIDQAISNVSNLSGSLGAFQSNTLQANATNLQASLTNTTSAESTVVDTNFASEIANFTKLQTQLQAGATVLGTANQSAQLTKLLLGGL